MQRVIEALESRIAPAAVFTYTEADGDKVTIKTSAKISNADFKAYMEADEHAAFVDGNLDYLGLIDPIFRDTNLTITVKKSGGDGKATIGGIYSDWDLKNVTIKGDVRSIVVGDQNVTTPGIGKLTVNNLGTAGDTSFFAGAGSIKIKGDLDGSITTEGSNIGSIKISGEVLENGFIGVDRVKSIVVGGDFKGGIVAGSLDSVRISGSLIGGDLGSSGDGVIQSRIINSIRIGGSIVGGERAETGSIDVEDRLGSVVIGGSVQGGSAESTGNIRAASIGSVTVRGDVKGGSGEQSAWITADYEMDKVTIVGDVLGGGGESSGNVGAGLLIGTVRIGGDIVGGLGANSGFVATGEIGTIGKIIVRGSVIGGGEMVGETPVGGTYSGRIAGYRIESLQIGKNLAGGTMSNTGAIDAYSVSKLKIGGSILGGFGELSGAINVDSLGSLTVGKDVIAGEGDYSARIGGFYGITSVKIGGAMEGNREGSGSIVSVQGSIGSISIGKGLTNTGEGATGIYAFDDIGKVSIKGDVVGGAYGTLSIRAGFAIPSGADAIESISIKGNVSNFLIEAGLSINGDVNADASIGTVNVKGNFETSSIIAGLGAGTDGFYGTDDDVIPSERDEAVVSRIASVVIGGTASGTVGGMDSYGIIAQHIVSLKVKGAKQTLEPGPINDLTGILLGSTEDFRVRELPALEASLPD